MVAYYQPTSLEEARSYLDRDGSLVVMAGGTDVYPAKTTRAGWGSMRHGDILDISRVPGLHGIEDRGDHWWIGALTTWSDLVAAPLPPLFDGLKAAALEIGGIQIQNRGTIGGNICTASPAGDGIPCLLSLDAEIECYDGTTVCVPAEQFFTGYRRTAVTGGGKIVTGVRIPKAPGRGYFQKLGARRYLVISIAMVAATFDLESDSSRAHASVAAPSFDAQTGWPVPVVKRARIAVGACSAVAQRLPALERDLVGMPINPSVVSAHHLAGLAPIDDIIASADYRRAAALELIRDILTRAARSVAT